MVTGGYNGSQEVRWGYKRLQGVTTCYIGLQEGFKWGYQGLQGVTGGYRGLQGVRSAYTELKEVTECYKGLPGVSGITRG